MADGLLNKASIILTPTGYKAGTLYNVAPVVEPYEDFDFARASVASRVNSSGLVEMVGRTLSSELVTNGDFATDSDWTKGAGWSIADGVANNDGTINAIYQPKAIQSGKIYKCTIDITFHSAGVAYWRLGNTTNIGVMSTNQTSFTQYLVGSANGNYVGIFTNTSITIDNVSVKEVIDTNNIPRISYDSNGDNGHILLEPTSTNLFEYSESFNTAEWNRSAITVVDNSSQSPDGANNASLMYPSSSGDFRYLHNSTIASSSKYTISAFVKASGKNVVWMYINSSSQNGFIYYDLSDQTTQAVDGTTGTPTATIKSYANDWYKISFTTATSITLNSGSGVGVCDAKGDAAVTVNGTDGVLVWGLQLEALSYATSYIPTLTGSTVTRATETATGAGSATLINSTEGVLYAEIAALADTDTTNPNRGLSISSGSTNNTIYIYYQSTLNTLACILISNGTTQFSHSTSLFDVDNYLKIALKYKQDDFALWVNGVEVATDTIGNVPIGLNELAFDNGVGVDKFYGKCKALAVFNEALSDSELTQLTT